VVQPTLINNDYIIMKYKNLLFAISIGTLFFAACEKTSLRSVDYELPSDKAFVRFALLSPTTPSVMIKVDTMKVNGANTSGNGGIFPAFFNSPDYTAVKPNGNFRLSLPNISTANDSVLIFSGALNLQAGKFYSVALADTGVDRTVFANEDIFVARPPDSMMNIRFINAMAKTPPLSLIRVDSTSATVVIRDTIFRNIAFKEASPFATVRVYPKNGFIRYRMVITSTGQPVGTSYTYTLIRSLFTRSVTFYAGGFGNGTGSFAPIFVGPVYNQ
jgi:hypothetical protein